MDLGQCQSRRPIQSQPDVRLAEAGGGRGLRQLNEDPLQAPAGAITGVQVGRAFVEILFAPS
ncbi:MAG: hypothetical protein QHH75_14735 [Bacillota bacterium]|nr:hypothetical protein [Bacillota bacterium]